MYLFEKKIASPLVSVCVCAIFFISCAQLGSNKLDSISIKQLPNKLTYEKFEYFIPDGLVITENWSDDSQVDIAYDDVPNAFTFSTVDMSTTGTKIVTFSYKEKNISFNIAVKNDNTYDSSGEATSDNNNDSNSNSISDALCFITYDANGGSGVMEAQQFQTGQYCRIATCLFDAPDGYHFGGWSTSSNGYWEYDEEDYIIFQDSLVLYAVWIPNNAYLIRYYLNGGMNSTDNPKFFTLGEEVVLKAPSKSGFIFEGWYDTDDFESEFADVVTEWTSKNDFYNTKFTGGYDRYGNKRFSLYAKYRDILSISSLRAKSENGKIILSWKNPDVDSFFKNVIEYNGKKIEVPMTEYGANEYVKKEIDNLPLGTEYAFTIKTYDESGIAHNEAHITATTLYTNPSFVPVAPENKQGNAKLAEFITDVTPHLYLSSKCVGQKIGLDIISRDGDPLEYNRMSKYRWLKWSSSKNAWTELPLAENRHGSYSGDISEGSRLSLTISGGTEYYCLAVYTDTASVYEGEDMNSIDCRWNTDWEISDASSVSYSKVCTVECGTERTEKIGYIAYDDGSISSDYEEGKVPIGIVSCVDEYGNPNKIVSLEESTEELKWMYYDLTVYDSFGNGTMSNISKGYYYNYYEDGNCISCEDGSNNWNVVKEKNEDASIPGKYPAFEYCDSITTGHKNWYFPARDEISQYCFNRLAINEAVSKLNENNVIAIPIEKRIYISSSNSYSYHCGESKIIGIEMMDLYVFGTYQLDNLLLGYVRAVSSF